MKNPQIVRLFIHPTRDCNLGCTGCYLTDIPGVEELIQTELPLEYFEKILKIAANYGFDELGLLINPQDMADQNMVLAIFAKKYGMLVNMTTTHHVALSMTKAQLDRMDFLSISVDTERFKKPSQVLKYIGRVSKHLDDNGWTGHLNINLTYTVEVFEWVKDPTFINQLHYYAETISHLMMKPIEQYYGSFEAFDELLIEAFKLEHLDITGTKSDKDIGEPCVYHMTGLKSCYAGYEELSIDPNGRLSGCVFDAHETDVSTPEKFESYLMAWYKTRAPVKHCALVQ